MSSEVRQLGAPRSGISPLHPAAARQKPDGPDSGRNDRNCMGDGKVQYLHRGLRFASSPATRCTIPAGFNKPIFTLRWQQNQLRREIQNPDGSGWNQNGVALDAMQWNPGR